MSFLKALVVFAALLAVAQPAFAEIQEEEDVLVLTDENFSDAVAQHKPLLVEFYAPWCGHCKSLAPEYAKAAGILKKEGIRIAKLDATAHTEASSKHQIKGFPTLKFFKGDDIVVDYEAGRTADAIVNWVKKKTGPAAATFTTLAEFEKFQQGNEVAVLGVFANLDNAQKKIFDGVADAHDSVAFGVTNNAEIKAKLDIKADNAIVLLKKFDEGRNDYSGDLSNKDEIADFIKSNSLPLVITFSDKNAQKIFGGEYNIHTLAFLDVEKHVEDNKPALEEVAKAFRGKSLVIIVPSHESRITDYFGVTADQLPRVITVRMEGNIKRFEYPVSGKNIVADDLKKFLTDFFNGDIKPTYKSADIPESDDDAVKVIVGKNFDDVVLNHGGKQDVFLEFYAPWCGHCKALAPQWEELAEKFADVPSLVIGKMDATANEHPMVNVQGFPTLLFYPANDPTNPISYDQSTRDVPSFVSFLKKKVSIPFELDGEKFGEGEAAAESSEKEDL